MTLKKNFRNMLFGLMLVVAFISVIPLTTVHASTYNLTVKTENIKGCNDAKRVCGYVKDSNGNPLANQTVYVARYDNYISSKERNKIIEVNDIRGVVKTDSNGYYSLNAYESGYYEVFLPSRTLSNSELEGFLVNGGEWPSRFVIHDGGYYACHDNNVATYVLISNR